VTVRTDDGRTNAQRWADAARLALNSTGLAGFATFLADGFVQESRRSAPFEFHRTHVLGSLEMMTQMGLTVDGTDIATAGDQCLLTQRVYRHRTGSEELLAVSVWDDQGHLVRFIEFDPEDLDEALETLAAVSGEPVVMCTHDGRPAT
jgi:hypothetical protein